MAKKKKSAKKSKPKQAATKAKPTRAKKSAVKKSKPAARKSTKSIRKASRRSANRQSWIDPSAQAPLIDSYARELTTFIDAMADGRIDDAEIKSQEKRLVDLMREIEPKLDDRLHERVTRLLCEITAYDIMHMLHMMAKSGPPSEFRG
jgi:hypothetical protein